MNALYLCMGCLRDQAIVTSAIGVVYTPLGAWVAACTCPDCGYRSSVLVSPREASEVSWWVEQDRAVAECRRRAYARSLGWDPDRLSEVADEAAEWLAGRETA